ncbi:MAG TPA: HlyD family efflux transporter periplasmic adaptor subunit [Cyclobacteriaceae bacterium]|jgi:HlyD family secretion protein
MNTHANLLIGLIAAILLLTSCSNDNGKADGYGNFEATEITVSAEGTGKLMSFNLEEGDRLTDGQVIGYIDTIQLSLKKAQLQASRQKILASSSSVLSQIGVYREQERTLTVERDRILRLMKDSAATQRQLDDVEGRLSVLQRQIASVRAQNASVLSELESLEAQLAQLDDQIKKCIIRNPQAGTVLIKYAEPGEVTAFGKPLYRIGKLDEMILRVYVSETQLPSLTISKEVDVRIDDAESMRTLPGTITWISSSAEFTPKVIQTKEERVNLVYAVKVSVKNDGALKIGMPGEMWIR